MKSWPFWPKRIKIKERENPFLCPLFEDCGRLMDVFEKQNPLSPIYLSL